MVLLSVLLSVVHADAVSVMEISVLCFQQLVPLHCLLVTSITKNGCYAREHILPTLIHTDPMHLCSATLLIGKPHIEICCLEPA